MNYRTTPLYIQLADSIKSKIINGTYEVGSKIPSERDMSLSYGITRVTVRRALDKLIKDGILVANVGSGTYVTKMPEAEKRINLGEGSSSRLTQDIRMGGMNPSKKIINVEHIKISEELKTYFKNESYVYRLTRLMLIDDKPYAVQVAHLPSSIFEGFERCDFKKTSLYDYMESENHMPVEIKTALSISKLPKEYLKYLKIKNDKKVFYFRYIGYDKDDNTVEFTQSYNLTEYTEFKFTIKRF